jgi:hypothetical protein
VVATTLLNRFGTFENLYSTITAAASALDDEGLTGAAADNALRKAQKALIGELKRSTGAGRKLGPTIAADVWEQFVGQY